MSSDLFAADRIEVTGVSRRACELPGCVRTSITLEPAFWRELERLAKERGVKTFALVRMILRANPGIPNRARLLRLYVLDRLLRDRSEGENR